MKYIRKAGCPHTYSHWCKSVSGTDNADYIEIPSEQKQTILDALLLEQGELCAYTMRRIGENSSHIEHIKPQSRCRQDEPESDLDYNNLIACYPRDGMETGYRYGAQKKGDWWEDEGRNFVSPLNHSCEACFRFDLEGKIYAVGNHTSARITINVLALDNKSLSEDRKRAIEEFIYGKNRDDPLSRGKTIQAEENICDRDSQGNFYEFCIAIKHALQEHLENLNRISQRRRLMQRRN